MTEMPCPFGCEPVPCELCSQHRAEPPLSWGDVVSGVLGGLAIGGLWILGILAAMTV